MLRPLLLALLVLLGAVSARAQEERYALALRDVSLQQALEELVALTRISLVYGPEVDGAGRVFCRANDAPAEALLRCIVESAGFDFYRLSSGTYVVVERAEQAPRYGALAGAVVDGETGEPLPGASVLLADASAGTAASPAGLFTFSRLAPGPYVVVASFVGYEPAAAEVWVPADGQARRRIALRPKPFSAAPVVVDGLQQRAPSSFLGQPELAEAALRTAALGPADPVGGARTLLGVARRPLTADLHIQGGEAGEHITTLDGVPVFDPVALGRLLGAFSPLAVERLTVRKAGFGAAHGSYTAGLVEVEQALPPGRPGLTVQADPYALDGRASYGTARASAMVASRTSLWDAYRPGPLDAALRRWNDVDPVLTAALTGTGALTDGLAFLPHRHGSDVAFTDLHAAARVRLGAFHTLRASGYRGASEVGTELFAGGFREGQAAPERISLSRDRYRWTNLTGRVRYEGLVGARALAHAGVRASRHTLTHTYQTLDGAEIGYTPTEGDAATFEALLRDSLDARPQPDDGNRFTEVAFEAGLDYGLAAGHLVEVGVEAAFVAHDFHLDNPYFRPLRSEAADGRLAAYMQDRLQLSQRATLETGLRLTFLPAREAVYAEPRLAVRYDAEAGPLGPYALRLAAGLYRQFVNQFDLTNVGPSALVPSVRFWLPADASLTPPSALHLAAEGLLTPATGWALRAEAYYKDLPRLLALDYAALLRHGDTAAEDVEQAAFIGEARGHAAGGGVRVEREARRLRFQAGYDLSVSRRTFPSRFGGALQPAPWNEPHRALLSADLDAGRGLTFRARGRGAWGRTWGLRQAYYDFIAAHGGHLAVGLPDADRLPPRYELDLGVSYARTVAGARLSLGLDVLNVLDRADVLDYSLRRVTDADGRARYVTVPRTSLGLQPVVTLRLDL